MKNFGFTLSEVLITLGIIGVIAAITLPSLRNDTSTAQIGPKLAKMVSSFEQANQALMNAEGIDSLTENYDKVSNYLNNLSAHLKCTIVNSDDTSGKLQTKDGMTLTIGSWKNNTNRSQRAHNRKITSSFMSDATKFVEIDINGTNPPDKAAADKFYFVMYDDGSLRAVGSESWNGNSNDATWNINCSNGAIPLHAEYCTGSIFANNLKVMYKIK